ncbi:hypothetical protein D3C86_1185190 [compost metagenome]
MNLDGVRADTLGHFGGEKLGHRSFRKTGFPRLLQRRRMQHQLPRRRYARRHIRKPKRHRLMLDDCLPEGLALAGIIPRRLESGLRHADRLRGDTDAAAFQIGERNAISLPLFAEPQFDWDCHVGEGDLAGIGRMQAEFFLDPDDLVTRCISRHDEGADALLSRRRIGDGKNDDDVAILA